MEITKLDPNKKKKAADVLAAAFFNYPMFTFYFPDSKRRARYLAWYLGGVLDCALRYGEVYTTPEIDGVIFTLPPGHTRISTWEFIQNGFLRTPFIMGFRNYVRSSNCETFVGDTHEKVMNDRPHYYLWGIVVDPKHQQKGIGSALLKPLILKADSEKKPIYLETHDERNVEYYQRMGFALACSEIIPKYGLKIWCMVREPIQ